MSCHRNISLFVHSLSGGGAERVTANLASYFARKDHNVTLVTVSEGEGILYSVDPRVQVYCLSMDQASNSVYSAVFANLSRVLKLRKILKSVNTDIVISMMTDANIVAALACVGSRMTCVGSERNYPGKRNVGSVWQNLRKYVYYFTDVIVVQTMSADVWIRENTFARNIIVIPNSIKLPLPTIEPIQNADLLGDSKVILAVGRLVQQKQFNHLIDIFNGLASQYPDWILVIVGEGKLRLELEERVRQINLADRILLPGRVGNLSDWYRKADIFALTSSYEGFPNVLLEAMSHNVCSVSYDCDAGPSDIIDDGVTGRLVPADDKAQFSQILASLMKCEVMREKMGRLGNQSVMKNFKESKVMLDWDNLLRVR